MHYTTRENFEAYGVSQQHFPWGKILRIHEIPIGECTVVDGEVRRSGVEIVESDGAKCGGVPAFFPYVRKDGKWQAVPERALTLAGAIVLALAFITGDVKAAQYACKVLSIPM